MEQVTFGEEVVAELLKSQSSRDLHDSGKILEYFIRTLTSSIDNSRLKQTV
jgi:hypothetical protein